MTNWLLHRGWKPIADAPKDREIIVFAPGIHGLKNLVAFCLWHEAAGFTIDELRETTLWIDKPC